MRNAAQTHRLTSQRMRRQLGRSGEVEVGQTVRRLLAFAAFGATILLASLSRGDPSAQEVAGRWLSGLQLGSADTLAASTAVPFTYREA